MDETTLSSSELYPQEAPSVIQNGKAKAGKRKCQSNDWKFDLTASIYDTLTRAEVYSALEGECSSLIVCMVERTRVTLPSGVLVGKTEQTWSHGETRLHDYHICARFKSSLPSSKVATIVEHSLTKRVSISLMAPIQNWRKAVEEASRTDLDAALKDIDESTLDWRNRLWLRIVYGKVRTVRSLDPVFMELAARHIAVKSTFADLINRYQQCKNKGNMRRVTYSQCTNPLTVDGEIRNDVTWARLVLDWFAERLVPADLNRRSLYLWGRAGVGKTRFVDRLLEAQMCIHRDCSESFFLQGLSEDFDFVWLDEFVPDTIMRNKEYRQQFNKLTGRERVMVRVKGGEQYEVDADNIRTVITSNDPPLSVDFFRRRFYVVEANDAMYGAPTEQSVAAYPESGVSRRKQRPQCRNITITADTGTTVNEIRHDAKRPRYNAGTCSEDDE